MATPHRAATAIGCVVLLAIPLGLPAHGSQAPPGPGAVLGEALDEALTIADPRARDDFLKQIGYALALAGLPAEAERVALAIESDDRRYSLIDIIAGAYAEAGDTESALDAARSIDPGTHAHDRDRALRRIGGAQARAGDAAGALATTRLHRGRRERPATLAHVAEALAEAGAVDAAIDAALNFDDPANPDAAGNALLSIVRVQAEAGDVDAALRTIERHLSDDDASAGLASIASARWQAGDADATLDAARRILDDGGDWHSEAQARLLLVQALIARGDLDEARSIAAGPWQERVPGQSERFMSVGGVEGYRYAARKALAEALAERGRMAEALASLHAIDRLHNRLDVLASLAASRLDAGDRDAAERALTAGLARAEEDGNEYSAMPLAPTLIRLGRLDEARAIFSRVLFAKSLGPPENRRVVVVNQARAGDPEGALQTVEAIPEPDIRRQALARLAATLADLGDSGPALALAGRIDDEPLRAVAYARIGSALLDSGEPALAADACRLASELPGPIPPEAAQLVAHALASLPDGLPDALAWARRLDSPEARADALLGIGLSSIGRPPWVPPRSPYSIPGPIRRPDDQ